MISFDKSEIVLNSPNNTYPLSFSVIYRDNIVSLFEKFGFVCYRLTDFTRNYEFEEILNSKQFQYDWVIDNNLYGFSNGNYWVLDKTDNWIEAKIKLPFNNRPTLFNDNNYISFCDCQGEFGGTVYFYNRTNQNTYFTAATCATSIIKTKDGYEVLSSLGHMMGGTNLIFISDPTKLSNLKDFDSHIDIGKALGSSDKSNHANKIFDFNGIETFSTFRWKDKLLYIVNWRQKTFLAEINERNFMIVDPLFNNGFYTHYPITKEYENGWILINLDFYGTAKEREVSMIVIKDEKLTKIDWIKKQ